MHSFITYIYNYFHFLLARDLLTQHSIENNRTIFIFVFLVEDQRTYISQYIGKLWVRISPELNILK